MFRLWCSSILIISLSLSLFSCGGNSQWNRSEALSELYEAQDLWLSHEINSYSVNYATFPTFLALNFESINIEVSDGEPVGFFPASIGGSPVTVDNSLLGDFRQFDEVFTWLGEIINSSPYFLEITYDDDYGFPTYVLLQVGSNSQVSDSTSEFIYANFNVLQ